LDDGKAVAVKGTQEVSSGGDDHRWRRISSLCHDALERDAGERSEFVRQACAGDEALRREVESLLANHGEASDFLNNRQTNLVGLQIGAYQLTSLLGIGGMGEVYRARDTKLGRDVALKVLPAAFTNDSERLARFKREARMLASLSHPHIAAIHAFEDATDPPALVLELVEGETLEQRLEKGPLPIDEALAFARQIADALGAAHERGIVHRDLKPANIKITPAGNIKVLDFGLARTASRANENADALTRESSARIIGTPAYMSPEQARGKPVDKRTDVWAFGCVLFEMLTGQPAFSGETITDTLAEILHRDPPWSRLPSTTPARIRLLLERCLEKDVARRLAEIGDARVELDTEVRPAAGRRNYAFIGMVAFVVIGVIGLALAINRAKRDRSEGPPARTLMPLPLTTYPGLEYDPSFSPDGRQVAFAWNGPREDNWDIYVKVVGSSAEPLRLTHDGSPDRFPAWSPSGREIAFARGKEIILISPLGGAEQKLADFEASSQLSWSPDGKWIVASTLGNEEHPGGISLISRDGEDVRRITTKSLPVEDRSPLFSPDGKWLAFGTCSGGFYNCDVYAVNLAKAAQSDESIRLLTNQGMVFGGLVWTDANTIVYSGALPGPGNSRLNYRLFRVGLERGIDPESIEFAGNPSMLALSHGTHHLAYAHVQSNTEIWTLENGRPVRSPLTSTGGDSAPAFSADGSRIAFVSNRSGNAEIWVANADGSQPRQLTSSGDEVCGSPRWSPDGKRLAFDRLTSDGVRHIFVIDAAGGTPRRLLDRQFPDRVPSWSGDGKAIYFTSSAATGKNEIFRMNATGGDPVQLTNEGGYVAFESPDRQSLYYLKAPVGSAPLFTRRVSGGEEHQLLDFVYGRAFFVADRGIYYIDQPRANGAFPVRFLDFATGAKRLVADIQADVNGGLAVARDGKKILFVVNTPRMSDLEIVDRFH
jgi:Tol biopolymer transport system component